MVATIWKDKLDASPLHGWFEAFEADAPNALHDLLAGRFDLANLSEAEPRALLSGWVLKIGEAGDFAKRVDDALTGWIAEHWGKDELGSRSLLLATWETVGAIVSATYQSGASPALLEASALALRERLADATGFAAHLFSARGTDAFFACLSAVALYQRDDSLRSFWWRLAELPAGFPVRYAGLALTGIRRLPSPGEFRYDVAGALFVVAKALSRLEREGMLDAKQALEEIEYLFRRSRRQYPTFENEWAEVVRREVRDDLRQDYTDSTWQFLTSIKARSPDTRRAQTHVEARDDFGSEVSPLVGGGLALTWDARNDPDHVTQLIENRRPDSNAFAEALLEKQRDYALRTGNRSFLVKSLHRFATGIRDWNIRQAEQWTREQVRWEPNDARVWTLLVDVIKRDDPTRCWQLAWATTDRFPFDAYSRTGLAGVLKAQGRLSEAEEVYRQAVEDFPDNVVARTGWAEVLKAQGRLSEAEEVYRQAVENFPESAYALSGLAYVRSMQGSRGLVDQSAAFQEAVALYRAVSNAVRADMGSKVIALCGWGWIEWRLGHLAEAENLYEQARRLQPQSTYALEGLNGVRRALAAGGGEDSSMDDTPPEFLAASDTPFAVPGQTWQQTLDEDAFKAGSGIQAVQESTSTTTVLPTLPRWNATGYHLRMARAAFLRRSAKRQTNLPIERRAIDPGRLRDGARKLLNEVLALRASDARAHAEIAALALDEGVEPPAPTGDAVALLAVAAQAVRIKAQRGGYKLKEAAQKEAVLRPVMQLRGVHPSAAPLAFLQEGLAYFAVQDGAERLDLAARAFTRVRNYARPGEAEAQEAILEAKRKGVAPAFSPRAWCSHMVAKEILEPARIDPAGRSPLFRKDAENLDSRIKAIPSRISDIEFAFARQIAAPVEDLLDLAG
jgi:tetratricopeptide (TPR) repeat protein